MSSSTEIYEWLDFHPTGHTGNQVHGACPFCGAYNKFFVNPENLLWSCVAGECQRTGNVFTYMEEWIKLKTADGGHIRYEQEWIKLEINRGIPVEFLRQGGVIYDPIRQRWGIPIRNKKGTVTNIRLYTIDSKLIGLPGIESGIYGVDTITNKGMNLYVCEGEWDTMAMRFFLAKSNINGEVCGVPGASIFKDEWADWFFTNKRVKLCYDAGVAGTKGMERATSKLGNYAATIERIVWPITPTYINGYDVRDYVYDNTHPGAWKQFEKWFVPAASSFSSQEESRTKTGSSHAPGTSQDLGGGQKPPFQKVLDAFAEHYNFNEEMDMTIRIAFAVCNALAIPGDPLWMYIVAPPSSGKTIVLNPMKDSPMVISRSSLTPASLISGWRTPDGSDPSLLSKVHGKVLVLKDFTEILDLNKPTRDDIYSILRGAYDGTIERSYGHGVVRNYTNLHFNILAAVTHAVYAERSATLGERFLMVHTIKGNDFNPDDTIARALGAVGTEPETDSALSEVVCSYINNPPTEDEVQTAFDSCDDKFHTKIIGLAQLVAMLRGQVQRDFREEKLLYRPQIEVGARLAKQLKKLAVSLALLETPIGVNANVYKLVQRVAFDTCIGFNLEIMQAIYVANELDIADLTEFSGIPSTTLRSCVDDLVMLGVLDRTDKMGNENRRKAYYSLSTKAKLNWERADINFEDIAPDGIIHVKMRRRK